MQKLVIALVATLGFATACRAGTAFDEGTALYGSNQFAPALAQFQQANLENPGDAINHYYIALCYHHMNRLSEAAREYGWILHNTADRELLQRAQVGLQASGQILGSSAGQGLPKNQMSFGQRQTGFDQAQPGFNQAQAGFNQAQSGFDQRFGSPRTAMETGQVAWGGQMQAQAAPPPTSDAGMPHIYDMYTNWCTWCKVFSPIFQQAAARHQGQIIFQSLDGEAAANERFVRAYKVRGYPTILMTDGSGKLVGRIDGAPQTLEDFETLIQKAYPSLR